MIAYSGMQWSGRISLRPGAFVEHPDRDELMQVHGIYELQHHTKEPADNVLAVAYFSWLPDTTDTLDKAYGVPLYRKQPELSWIRLTEFANLVRSSLMQFCMTLIVRVWYLCQPHYPQPLHLPLPPCSLTLQNPAWVHTIPDWATHPQHGVGLDYRRKNTWLRHAPRLHDVVLRVAAVGEVVPNANAVIS